VRAPARETARKITDRGRIVAEVNQGGDLVEQTIRAVDPNAAFTAVRASRGKLTRAEPISALYGQGRVHHLGVFPALEDQMVAFTPDIDRAAGSPDRADALVWALAELMIAPMASFGIYELYRQMAEEQSVRESARIAAPDPRQRRQEAIVDERSRYAALMTDRLPTAEEAAAHGYDPSDAVVAPGVAVTPCRPYWFPRSPAPQSRWAYSCSPTACRRAAGARAPLQESGRWRIIFRLAT
jgi:hypothetical protein